MNVLCNSRVMISRTCFDGVGMEKRAVCLPVKECYIRKVRNKYCAYIFLLVCLSALVWGAVSMVNNRERMRKIASDLEYCF